MNQVWNWFHFSTVVKSFWHLNHARLTWFKKYVAIDILRTGLALFWSKKISVKVFLLPLDCFLIWVWLVCQSFIPFGLILHYSPIPHYSYRKMAKTIDRLWYCSIFLQFLFHALIKIFWRAIASSVSLSSSATLSSLKYYCIILCRGWKKYIAWEGEVWLS